LYHLYLVYTIQTISFHIEDCCPSEKCDFEFHCIFNFVNRQGNEHFLEDSRMRKLFSTLWKSLHSWASTWPAFKYCFRDPTPDEAFLTWSNPIWQDSDSNTDQFFLLFLLEYSIFQSLVSSSSSCSWRPTKCLWYTAAGPLFWEPDPSFFH